MRTVALSLALLALSACGSDYDTDAASPEAPPSEASGGADVGYGDPIRGEIAALEQNADGKVEVGVTDEVVFFRLSEDARAEAQKEFANDEGEDGIGSVIKDMVGGVVTKALATTVQMPLEDIRDIRYEDGNLVIDGAENGATFDFGGGDSDGGITFEEDAAQRLIDAYEAAR